MASPITVEVSTPRGLFYTAEAADATLATGEGSVHFASGSDNHLYAPKRTRLVVRTGTEFHTLVMENASVHFHDQRLTVIAESADELFELP